MANLKYFDETVYGNLFADIKNNIDFYASSDVELKDLLPNIPYYGESTISANLPSELDFKNDMNTDEKNKSDIVNTRFIYEALKTLSPLVATNGYLWSYLCHTKYKKYVIARWIKNPEDEDKHEGTVKTIQKRFFCSSNKKDIMRMNAISRLWWAGYLTYDKNHGDPYHLTKILFTGQQICADILDTPFCGNKTIITGILLAIEQYKGEVTENINSELVRKCIKYFRRYAAVTNVDFLSETEIQNIIFKYLSEN